MKYLFIALFVIFPDVILGQIKIFTTDSINFKEWKYNQRKIIRSPEIGIIAESVNGIFYSQNLNDPIKIFDGKNTSLAIDNSSNIHIVYENNGIKYSSKKASEDWTTSISISDSCEICSYPIADCDMDGNVHIVYSSTDSCINDTAFSGSLKYVKITDNQRRNATVIYKPAATENTATLIDYSIATHLLYLDETLFVTYQLSNDSIYLKYSIDSGNSWKLGAAFRGTVPSLSIGCGQYRGELRENLTYPAILYIDSVGNLAACEVEVYITISDSMFYWYADHRLHNGPIDFLCIDDVLSPFGFSFIFQKEGTLYHAFTDFYYRECEIMDTITDNVVVSSIAYKQFDLEKVDIVWFEKKAEMYEMYYQCFDKIPTVNNYINEESNLFQLAADPNPFNTNIKFTISTSESDKDLKIYIYNIEGTLLKTFKINNYINQSELYWDGFTDNGNQINPGIYIIKVISGTKSLTRKIVCSN